MSRRKGKASDLWRTVHRNRQKKRYIKEFKKAVRHFRIKVC